MLCHAATPAHCDDSDSSRIVASKNMETEVSHHVVLLHRLKLRDSVVTGWVPYLFAPEVATRYIRLSTSVLALLWFVALATCEEVSSDRGGASAYQTSQLVPSTKVYVTADESDFHSIARNAQSNTGVAVSATASVNSPLGGSVTDRVESDLTYPDSTTSAYPSIQANVFSRATSINVDSTNFADSSVPYSRSATSVVRSVSLVLHATSPPHNPFQVLQSSISTFGGQFTADGIHGGSIADASQIITNSEFVTVSKINNVADVSSLSSFNGATTPTFTVLSNGGVDPAEKTIPSNSDDFNRKTAAPNVSVVETLNIKASSTRHSSVEGIDSVSVTNDFTSSISTTNEVHVSTTGTPTSEDFASSHKLRVSTLSTRPTYNDSSLSISRDSSLPPASLNARKEHSQYDSIYPSPDVISFFDAVLSTSFIETAHDSRLQYIDTNSLPTSLLSTPYLLSPITIDSDTRQQLATPELGISHSATGAIYATSTRVQENERSAGESDYYLDPTSIQPEWGESPLRDQEAGTYPTPSLPVHVTSQIVPHSTSDSSRSGSVTPEYITTQFDPTTLMSTAFGTTTSSSVFGLDIYVTTLHSISLLGDVRYSDATTSLGATENILPHTSTMSDIALGTIQDSPLAEHTMSHTTNVYHPESADSLSTTASEATTKAALLMSQLSSFNIETSLSYMLPSILSTMLEDGKSSGPSVTTYPNSIATNGADVYALTTYSAGMPSSHNDISGETIIPTATVHPDSSVSYTLANAQSTLLTGGEMEYVDTGTSTVPVSVSSSLDMFQPFEGHVQLTETISRTTESGTFSASSVMFGNISSSTDARTRSSVASLYDTHVMSTIPQQPNYRSPDAPQRSISVVYSSEILAGVHVTKLNALSILPSMPQESITVTHTLINAHSNEQNTESNNQVVLTTNEYDSTVSQSSPILPTSAKMRSLATQYTESELVSLIGTANSGVNPSRYTVDTTHILSSSPVFFQRSTEVKHSTAMSTYEVTTEYIAEPMSTFGQVDILEPSYSAQPIVASSPISTGTASNEEPFLTGEETVVYQPLTVTHISLGSSTILPIPTSQEQHAYVTEFVITADDRTEKETTETTTLPTPLTTEEQATPMLRITPTSIAVTTVQTTPATEHLNSNDYTSNWGTHTRTQEIEIAMETQEQTAVTFTTTELAHSEPRATTFVFETIQEMLSSLTTTVLPTSTTEQATITATVSPEHGTTNASVSLILEQMTATAGDEPTILELTATPLNVSPTIEQATTTTVVKVSSTLEQATTTIVNVSPIMEHAATTYINVSPTMEHAATTIVNVSPTIEQAVTTVVNASPTIEQAVTTVVNVSPTIEHAMTTVVNVSPTVGQAETTVVNVSPTIEQAVTTVVNVSPTIEQAVTTVVNVSPTIEHAMTTVVNVSPTVGQAETTVANVSPTIEQSVTTVNNVSPTVEQAMTTVADLLTFEQTALVNVPTNLEQTTTDNVPSRLEQTTMTSNVPTTLEQITTTVNVPTTLKQTTATTNMSTMSDQTTTSNVPTTLEQSTTGNVPTTLEQTITNVSTILEQTVTTVKVPTTLEQIATTVNGPTTLEQTTTADVPITLGQTTTTSNVPTTLEQTTATVNGPTTLVKITTATVNVSTTLEQTTTNNVPMTLEQTRTTVNVPTTLKQTKATTNVPTTLEQTTTTTNFQTTLKQTTTTVSIPTTSEQTTTVNVPTTLKQTKATTNVPTTLEQTTTTTNFPTTLKQTTTTVSIPTTSEQTTTANVPTTLEQTKATTNVPTTLEQTTTANFPTTLQQPTATANVSSALQQTTTKVPTTLQPTTTATNVPTTLQHTTTTVNVPTTLQQPTTTVNVPTTLQHPTTTANVSSTLQQTTTNVPTTLQHRTTTTNIPTNLQQTTTTSNVPTTLQQTTTTVNVPTTLQQTPTIVTMRPTLKQRTPTRLPIHKQETTTSQVPLIPHGATTVTSHDTRQTQKSTIIIETRATSTIKATQTTLCPVTSSTLSADMAMKVLRNLLLMTVKPLFGHDFNNVQYRNHVQRG